MTDAADRIEALTAENFKLAAGSCDVEGGKIGDEHGHFYCTLQAKVEAQAAEIERLREALVEEREENLWNAYATGDVRGDEWTHLFMSDGEWLARECGFDPKQGYYSAEAIRNAIPIAARAALDALGFEILEKGQPWLRTYDEHLKGKPNGD